MYSRNLLEENRSLKITVQTLQNEIMKKDEIIEFQKCKIEDIDTQLIHNDQFVRNERNKIMGINLQLENATMSLEIETNKRNKLEKRIRKFVNWLRYEQNIYIEDIYSKLGIEENKYHKRSSS